jgi:hypothetical protein
MQRTKSDAGIAELQLILSSQEEARHPCSAAPHRGARDENAEVFWVEALFQAGLTAKRRNLGMTPLGCVPFVVRAGYRERSRPRQRFIPLELD